MNVRECDEMAIVTVTRTAAASLASFIRRSINPSWDWGVDWLGMRVGWVGPDYHHDIHIL